MTNYNKQSQTVLTQPIRTTLSVRVASGTHPGRVRKLNEDSLKVVVRPVGEHEGAALLIVADGMGGHRGGDIASMIAVETIADSLSWLINAPDSEEDVPNRAIESVLNRFDTDYVPQTSATFLEMHLAMAIDKANRNIRAYALKNPSSAGNLGTTATCALIIGTKALIANIGDSRTYLLRDGVSRLLTTDHSLVGMLVEMGQIAPEELYDHPNRHLVTRSLGSPDTEFPDIKALTLRDGDRLLLCSDGLWEPLRDSAEFHAEFSSSNIPIGVNNLIRLANEAGGPDNISVILAEMLLT
ncbi:MAG: PP2C family protein-serine/threonine phosphatase [Candidatus Promineifilaceae bacterium]